MTILPEQLRKFALYYARHGWSVLPLHWPEGDCCSCHRPDCSSIGKHPLTEFGAYDATTDSEQIATWWQQWPQANDGLNVGLSGLIVIDGDPRHGARLQDLPLSPADRITTTVSTGGNGWHLYFRHPPALDISNSNRNCPPGVDIRAGEGAYVVAPPSLHVSGRRYRFTPGREPWTVPPRPLPTALLPILTLRNNPPPDENQRQAVARPTLNLDAQHPYVSASLNTELAHLAQAQPGRRNNALNQSAFNLGQFVGAGLLDRGEVEALLEQAAVTLGLSPSEIKATLQSGLEAGIKTPRRNWPDFDQTGCAS
ncbi:MAG: hypothetical protein FOGNACKC_02879 [Anaerolineae bacterium]|nr:hypothetical protein [Anaerolineae bacterium]